MRWVGACACAIVMVLALGTSHAEAFVYWVDRGADRGTPPPQPSIARAEIDGGKVDRSFIKASQPNHLAVDGAHIYWANTVNRSISRANLDGTGVEPNFVPTSSSVGDLAVDAGHIYWSNWQAFGAIAIGRANLDGSGVNQEFITRIDKTTMLQAIAVGAGHVYWTESSAPPADRIDQAKPRRQRPAHTLLSIPGYYGRAVRCACHGRGSPARPRRRRAPPRSPRAGSASRGSPFAPGRTVVAHFKLSQAGRKALKRRKHLRATITTTTRHGAQLTKRTLHIRLKAPRR